jgi:pimeloyl-ACP methyl ester carboxylesterase
MSEGNPAIVLVHGAFAESASWNAVIERLHGRSFDVTAVANPLRSVAGDAAYVRDVIAGIGRPVVLVGHSYGGIVITEAAAGNDAVVGLTELSRFMAKRAGSRATHEIAGASHALSVSCPDAVTAAILQTAGVVAQGRE